MDIFFPPMDSLFSPMESDSIRFLCVESQERTKALELKYKLAMEDTWDKIR